jgi:hypothetical protein
MRRTRNRPNFLAITLLVISTFACQTVTKAFSPGQSTSAPVPNIGDANLSLDWLVTPDELNSISSDIGIAEWKTVQDSPGQNRICRTFQGASWSATPNEGLNCILKVSKGSSFANVIDSMFKDGKLLKGAQPVKSTLKLDGEFAVYAGDYPNGHGVFDLIFMKNNLVYWSSVTLGTPAGESPLTTYKSASKVIDAFLANVVKKNLEKSK